MYIFTHNFSIRIFICWLFLSVNFIAYSQKYAPLKRLQKYGVKITQLPGEYKAPVTVTFTNDSNTRVSIVQDKNQKSKITGNSLQTYLSKNTTIFLRLYVNNKLIDTLFVGTYIFNKKSNLPVVCLFLNRADFDAPGGIITGSLSSSKSDSVPSRIGRVWRKESIPVFMEYFENGKFEFGARCRIKPFGGMTLSQSEKSLRLIADSTIGPKKFQFNPFLNKTKFKSFKSIVLRTSGNDQLYTRIKDMTLGSIARDLQLDYLDYRPSVLYVNGEYWGIYNIREKCNLEYLQQNHNAAKDNRTQLLELSGERAKEYNQMISYIGKKFPENSAVDSVNTKMVLHNYIDYIIWQIHIQNIDSRGNVRYWKSKSLDNRWRWIFYDSDLSSAKSQADFNYLAKRLSSNQTDWYNPSWATVILRNLLSHKKIKNYFINEYCFLLGTQLHPDTLQNRVALFASHIRPEIPDHVKRRNTIYGESVKSWENTTLSFKNFFKERHPTAIEHLKKCFGLKGNFSSLKVSCNIDKINTLRLRYSAHLFNKAEAKFFSDIPVEFEATNLDPRYKFIKWEQFGQDSSSIIKINAGKVNEIKAIYEKKENSKLYQKIICDFVFLKFSKKDSIYIIGITNNSDENIENEKITFKTKGSEEKMMISIGKLDKNQTHYFTNDSSIAKEVLKKTNFNMIDFPAGFDPRSKEWVLLDTSDKIIDSLLITAHDSIKKEKKRAFYYRDLETGNWDIEKGFKQEEKKEQRVLKNTLRKLPFVLVGLLIFLAALLFYYLRKKKKENNTIIAILFLLVSQYSWSQTKYPDRFGLDSIQTKLINNKGQGYDSIYGCRNFRVILKNLVYRGGNNNPLSVQNPLTLRTINDLKKNDFEDIIYLYSRNFEKFYPIERLDSLKQEGVNYVCAPSLDSATILNVLSQIHEKANSENPGLTYLHCWNGWHQSGWLSAMTLIQFCDYSNELALKYWTLNTDGNHKGYSHVKRGILDFKPIPGLAFTKQQKEKHCPCLDTVKLDTLYKNTQVISSSSQPSKNLNYSKNTKKKSSTKKRSRKKSSQKKSVSKNSTSASQNKKKKSSTSSAKSKKKSNGNKESTKSKKPK